MNMTRVCVNLGKFDLYYICMHYGSRLAMVDDGLESIVLIDSKGSYKGKFNERYHLDVAYLLLLLGE